MKIVCFHNPDEENGYLSNWYPSRFIVKNSVFSSMEQFMMDRKAVCFHDEASAAQILATEDVARITMIIIGMEYVRSWFTRACLRNFLRTRI